MQRPFEVPGRLGCGISAEAGTDRTSKSSPTPAGTDAGFKRSHAGTAGHVPSPHDPRFEEEVLEEAPRSPRAAPISLASAIERVSREVLVSQGIQSKHERPAA